MLDENVIVVVFIEEVIGAIGVIALAVFKYEKSSTQFFTKQANKQSVNQNDATLLKITETISIHVLFVISSKDFEAAWPAYRCNDTGAVFVETAVSKIKSFSFYFPSSAASSPLRSGEKTGEETAEFTGLYMNGPNFDKKTNPHETTDDLSVDPIERIESLNGSDNPCLSLK